MKETNRTRVNGRWKIVALAAAAVAALVLLGQLPWREPLQAFLARVEEMGAWGPVALGAVYAVGTVLFLPALFLTIAAGALFGLVKGFVTVSVSSTVGAGLAFLVGRYLARERIERLARANPRFGAIDGAIAEGGWRVVALLRLSPVVPFNLQNYFFGLTPIPFWTYLLTSWLAMMPGTLLYVYLGHLTGVAVGGTRERTTGEWVLLAVGLLATVAVTWYVTRLARRQLAARTGGQATEVVGDP